MSLESLSGKMKIAPTQAKQTFLLQSTKALTPNRACSTDPSLRRFTLYTHLQEIGLTPAGNGTRSHVSFFFRAEIPSRIAFSHSALPFASSNEGGSPISDTQHCESDTASAKSACIYFGLYFLIRTSET